MTSKTSKLFYLILFSVASFVLFNSCEKTYQNELIGKWKLETMGDSILMANPTYWTFYADNRIEILGSPQLRNYQTPVTGSYSVDAEWVIIPIVTITDIETLSGVYEVEELDKDILIMTRKEIIDTSGNHIEEGAYLRKEFVKQ